MNKNIKLIMLLVIALSLAATGCITYNETSDPADPEVVYVTQTPELAPEPDATPTPTLSVATPTPTPTLTLTSTKVVSTPSPTPAVIDTPKPSPTATPKATLTDEEYDAWLYQEKLNRYMQDYWQLRYYVPDYQRDGVDVTAYDDNDIAWDDSNRVVICFITYRSGGVARREASPRHIKHVEIFMDGQLIASYAPVVINDTPAGYDCIPNGFVIELPEGLTNQGRIRAFCSLEGVPSPEWSNGECVDGEYSMHIHELGYSDERFNDFPVVQAVYSGEHR